jgi:CDP-paratose 2-epimerase
MTHGRYVHDTHDMGIVQWFRFEHYDEVEMTIGIMQSIGATKLRTVISWADWERPGGEPWIKWMIDYCYRNGIEIFPNFFYTPVNRARLLKGESREDARTSFPPQRLQHYANFVYTVAARYGNKMSDWYQLGNEINNDAYWSTRHDPEYKCFLGMVVRTITLLQARRTKIILTSLIPPYLEWLALPCVAPVLEHADAIGIHAFPGTWDKMEWHGWMHAIQLVRKAVRGKQVWVTETGFSTVTDYDQSDVIQRTRKAEQVERFNCARYAPAEQVFWYCALDQEEDHPTDNMLNRPNGTCAPCAYHFGMVRRDGRTKPLYDYLCQEASVPVAEAA